jgi:hypothetical protein
VETDQAFAEPRQYKQVLMYALGEKAPDPEAFSCPKAVPNPEKAHLCGLIEHAGPVWIYRIAAGRSAPSRDYG